MRMRISLFLGILVLVSANLKADELEDMKRDFDAQLSQLNAKIDQLETAQKEKDTTTSDLLNWAKRIKFSADFRYRYERIDQDDMTKTRHRNRIRARVKMEGKVNDDIDFILRLRTGEQEPRSENQTLGESFSSKPFWLDQAYMVWHPESFNGFKVMAGKMKNPFFQVGGNEHLWHDAITPEGVAVNYKTALAKHTDLYFTGAGFWITEHATNADVGLMATQAYVKQAIGNSTLTCSKREPQTLISKS